MEHGARGAQRARDERRAQRVPAQLHCSNLQPPALARLRRDEVRPFQTRSLVHDRGGQVVILTCPRPVLYRRDIDRVASWTTGMRRRGRNGEIRRFFCRPLFDRRCWNGRTRASYSRRLSCVEHVSWTKHAFFCVPLFARPLLCGSLAIFRPCRSFASMSVHQQTSRTPTVQPRISRLRGAPEQHSTTAATAPCHGSCFATSHRARARGAAGLVPGSIHLTSCSVLCTVIHTL
jgi:hypothetical protein